MKQIKSLVKDRRGSTLVEIIVSVLIVGIAFVPLMMSLTSSLKANQKTERELYAENVAQNVVEICKAYGQKGIKAMANHTTGADNIGDIFTGATIEPLSVGYRINNIKAGTNCIYSAKIDFSTANYDAITPLPTDAEPDPSATPIPAGPKQNDFSGYPSLSAISNASTLSFSEDSLTYIVKEFHTLAVAKGSVVTEAEMLANVDKWLTRTMEIDVENPVTGENAGKFVVSKKVTYAGVANSKIGDNLVFGELDYAGSPMVEQVKEIGAYATAPGNIIATFKPMKNGTEPKKLASDKIVFNKGMTGKVNVYTLCENGSALTGWNIKVTVLGTDLVGLTDPNVGIYCNITPVKDGGSEFTKLTKFGDGTSDKQSVMKDVIIHIYDEFGQEVLEKTSTVIEFE